MNAFTIMFWVALPLSFSVFVLLLRPKASRSARKRLSIIQESVHPHSAGAHSSDLVISERQSTSARLTVFLHRYQFARSLKALLVQADSALNVGGACLLSSACAALCGLVLFLVVRNLALALIAAGAGACIPYYVFRFRRSRRLKHFNDCLPDAIDLMARSLRAGHAIGSAIEMVAEQMPEPLAFEFVQVYQQQRLGLQFREALAQMCERVPSRDLQFLVTAILVQKETGGDLTEILDRSCHVIRERVRIEGEVRTHTAQGRLTGWILSLLPVCLLVLMNLVSPGYSKLLFKDPVGQDLMYAGAALIVLGSVIIRKIVNVQV